VLPLPWFGSPLGDFLFAVGVLMAGTAIALDIAAMRAMARSPTTILPTKASDHLVTSGPFAVSRNPIYLANVMLTLAAALVFGIAWFLPAAFVAAFVTQKLAIEREERHLTHRFGKKYRDYQKRVRRWI
jgi:protein-S-isoprenylcysteine O-methyltransferase Ste14